MCRTCSALPTVKAVKILCDFYGRESVQNMLCHVRSKNIKTDSVQNMLCLSLYIISGFFVTEKVCRTCSVLSITKMARQRVCRTGSAMPIAKVYRDVQKILCIVRNKKYQDKECADHALPYQ